MVSAPSSRRSRQRAGSATAFSSSGNIPTFRGLLAAADFGLLTSREEGFSNVILEGMAAGLAMIVTDVGGQCRGGGPWRNRVRGAAAKPKGDRRCHHRRLRATRKRGSASAPRPASASKRSFRSINASRRMWTFIRKCWTKLEPRKDRRGIAALARKPWKAWRFSMSCDHQHSFNCHKRCEQERRMPSKDLRFLGSLFFDKRTQHWRLKRDGWAHDHIERMCRYGRGRARREAAERQRRRSMPRPSPTSSNRS